jgi:hypothetical protein
VGKDFYAGILIFAVGIFSLYMFFHATKERFYYSKTYSQVKYITPLPGSINYWIIKILFIVGGLLCISVGLYGISKPFL